MTVNVIYQVEHKGKIHIMTADRKTADQYDKMLAVADEISALIQASGVVLDEKRLEDLSIFLSRNNLILNSILKGKTFAELGSTLVTEKTPGPQDLPS